MPFTGTPWKLRGNRSIYMIIFLTLGLSIFLVVCPFFVRPPVFPIFTFIPEGRAEGRRSLQIWKLYSILRYLSLRISGRWSMLVAFFILPLHLASRGSIGIWSSWICGTRGVVSDTNQGWKLDWCKFQMLEIQNKNSKFIFFKKKKCWKMQKLLR